MCSQKFHTVYLCLGTNLGDKKENLGRALKLIGNGCGTVIRVSGIYVSGSWGYESNNDFYNQCLELETGFGPEELLKLLLEIEQMMGRARKGMGYADRVIDIDILFYNSLVLEIDHLHIPHPRIPERMFVLKPMMELDPEFVHPLLQDTISVLAEKCKDSSEVKKL